MSIPAKPEGEHEYHDLIWDDTRTNATTDIHVCSKGCSTIVFDSFSDEQDVRQRDTAKNRIGKLNAPERRFSTDFSVRVSGEVSAILSATTVSNYRLTERKVKGGQADGGLANALFLDSPPPPQTFSSVIMHNLINASPTAAPARVVMDIPSSSSSCPSSSNNTPPHAVLLSPADTELIASLAAATAPSSAPRSPPPPNLSWSTALSAVAHRLASTATAATVSATQEEERTDQLRKRCHNLLHQRNAMETQHKQRIVNQRNRLHFQNVAAPKPVEESGLAKGSFFFSSVPRPKEVHQTLIDAAVRRGMKEGQNGGALSWGGRGEPPIFNTLSQELPASLSAPETFASQLSGDTHSSAFTSIITGRRSDSSLKASSLLLPPMMPVLLDDAFAPEDHHRPRLSSSDLVFTSMVCPVPLNGLLNLQDIHFRHSSEEILAVSVLQDLRTKK